MTTPLPLPPSCEHNSSDCEPELSFYRWRTRSLLRKYVRIAVETGRLPSMLGRECFRAKVTSYPLHSFEDAVVFVHDMERSLAQLNALDQRLLAMMVMEDYTEEEAARLLRCARATLQRHYPEALDQLSEVLLRRGMIEPLSCQEAKKPSRSVSCCPRNE